MCLDIRDARARAPRKRVGYKQGSINTIYEGRLLTSRYRPFYRDTGRRVKALYTNGMGRWLPLGRWIKDPNTGRINMDGRGSYRAGFHIYLDNLDKKAEFRVRFRSVVATGKQFGRPVVVAREIFVCRPKKPRAKP
jgi:hypothetical protein